MEPNETCKICGADFDVKSFGYHLRKHKIRVQDYYEKYYPKHDLLTNDKIFFTNRENYFLHDFSYRVNCVRYFSENPDSELLLQTLLRHRNVRNWKYVPSQIELRSSILPARNFFEKHFGDYNVFMKQIGVVCRYLSDKAIQLPMLPSNLEIWEDTREQTPLKFSCRSRRVKLDFGDYTAGGANHAGVFIERKSLTDLVGTLSQGYDRFKAEIKRAADLDGYLVVCVEAPLKEAMNFCLAHTKCTPVFIFHRIKELMQEYGNIQFVFTKNRDEAAELITNILILGEKAKEVDLYYHYEKKQLCGEHLREKK